MPLRDLPVPSSTQASGDAVEILSVWFNSDGRLDMAAVPGFENPATWAAIFADAARHVARSYAHIGKGEAEIVLAQIAGAMKAELDSFGSGGGAPGAR